MVHLHTAAMRGLALELMFSRDQKKAAAAMKLLVRYKRQLTRGFVAKPFDEL